MSPSEIAALTLIIDRVRSWPVALLFFLVIVGPWVLALVLAYLQKKRFEGVVQMYQSNVRLVKDYEDGMTRYGDLAKDLKDVIILNTQAMTRVCDKLPGG